MPRDIEYLDMNEGVRKYALFADIISGEPITVDGFLAWAAYMTGQPMLGQGVN